MAVIIFGIAMLGKDIQEQPQEVFKQFSVDKEIALQQYNKLSDKGKESVNNLVKNDIKTVYDNRTEDYQKDYGSVADEIRKYKELEQLSSYFEDMKTKINSRYEYYSMLKKINSVGEIRNLDIRETYQYIEKIKTIPTDAEYYNDAQLVYAMLVDRYNQSGNKQIEIKKVKPYIGMSKMEVRYLSTWGQPKDINKTTNANGTREQWVYSLSRYLYFEDGKLTTIQE